MDKLARGWPCRQGGAWARQTGEMRRARCLQDERTALHSGSREAWGRRRGEEEAWCRGGGSCRATAETIVPSSHGRAASCL